MSDIENFRAFAEGLADCSRAILHNALDRPVDPEIKDDQSPVTAIDKLVEDNIRALITERYPDHGVLGEERADTNPHAEFKWVIDPIDGTLPFLAGIPVFGTLIALVQGERPVIGIIDLPMTRERWIGCRGRATTCNGEVMRTRPCADLADALMTTSNPNFWGADDRPVLTRLTAATRWGVYGGSCLAYGRIAGGRIDVGLEVNFDIHDYLALVPVVQGAGGIITDWNGDDLTTGSGDRFICAGDRRIHAQTLCVVAG